MQPGGGSRGVQDQVQRKGEGEQLRAVVEFAGWRKWGREVCGL